MNIGLSSNNATPTITASSEHVEINIILGSGRINVINVVVEPATNGSAGGRRVDPHAVRTVDTALTTGVQCGELTL